jgi:hypothetical protein
VTRARSGAAASRFANKEQSGQTAGSRPIRERVSRLTLRLLKQGDREPRHRVGE